MLCRAENVFIANKHTINMEERKQWAALMESFYKAALALVSAGAGPQIVVSEAQKVMAQNCFEHVVRFHGMSMAETVKSALIRHDVRDLLIAAAETAAVVV